MNRPFLVSLTLVVIVALFVPTVETAGLNQGTPEVNLWNGSVPGQGVLLYSILLDSERLASPVHRIWEGNAVGLPTILFNNRHFFDGVDRATPRFFISQDRRRIYRGANNNGEILYFLEPVGPFVRVHRGANTTGTILYTFGRDRVFAGPDTRGPIVLSTTGNLMQADGLRSDIPLVHAITLLLEMAPSLEEPEVVDFAAGSSLKGLTP